MGGRGSGQWQRRLKKPTAENCLVLDVNRLSRGGVLRPRWFGNLRWTSPRNGEVLATVNLRVSYAPNNRLALHLVYRLDDSITVDTIIGIEATRPHFGGQRLWFTCPRVANGIPCKRRAAKLYLRNGYFACRHCQDLRYRSSQEAHKGNRRFKRLFGNSAARRWPG